MPDTEAKIIDDWSSTKRRFENWAMTLEELRENAEFIGPEVVDDLTTRYLALQTEVDQLIERARYVRKQVKDGLDDVRDKYAEVQS
ncbi:MAG: hypothetical protein ACRBBN_20965 [Methyloligellaceae bacterium]